MSREVFLSANVVAIDGVLRLGAIVHGETVTTLVAHFKPGDTVTISLEQCIDCGKWAFDCACPTPRCCAAVTGPPS